MRLKGRPSSSKSHAGFLPQVGDFIDVYAQGDEVNTTTRTHRDEQTSPTRRWRVIQLSFGGGSDIAQSLASLCQAWYVSRVLESDPNRIKIHFELWHSKHDFYIPRSRFAQWIAPLNTHTKPMVPEAGSTFISEFSCTMCGEGGDILCCDSCPKVYHLECLGLEEAPEAEFECAYCSIDKARHEKSTTTTTTTQQMKQEEITTRAPTAMSTSTSARPPAAAAASSSFMFESSQKSDPPEHKAQHRYPAPSPISLSPSPPASPIGGMRGSGDASSPIEVGDSEDAVSEDDNDTPMEYTYEVIDSSEDGDDDESASVCTDDSNDPTFLASTHPMSTRPPRRAPSGSAVASRLRNKLSTANAASTPAHAAAAQPATQATGGIAMPSTSYAAAILTSHSSAKDGHSTACSVCTSDGAHFSCARCSRMFHAVCDDFISAPITSPDGIRLCKQCIVAHAKQIETKIHTNNNNTSAQQASTSTTTPTPDVSRSTAVRTPTPTSQSHAVPQGSGGGSKKPAAASKSDAPPSLESRRQRRPRSKPDPSPPPPPQVYPKRYVTTTGAFSATPPATPRNTPAREAHTDHDAIHNKSTSLPKLRSDNIGALAVFLRKIHWIFVHKDHDNVVEPPHTPVDMDVTIQPQPTAASSSSSSSHLASAASTINLCPIFPHAPSVPLAPLPSYLQRDACTCRHLFGADRKYPNGILTREEGMQVMDELKTMRNQMWNLVYKLQSDVEHLDSQWHEDIASYYTQFSELQSLLILEQSSAGLIHLTIEQIDQHIAKESTNNAAANANHGDDNVNNPNNATTIAENKLAPIRMIREEMKQVEQEFKNIERSFHVSFDFPFRRFADVDRVYQILVDVVDFLDHRYPLQSDEWHRQFSQLWSHVRDIQQSQSVEESTIMEDLVADACARAPFQVRIADRHAPTPHYHATYVCLRCMERFDSLVKMQAHVTNTHIKQLRDKLERIAEPQPQPSELVQAIIGQTQTTKTADDIDNSKAASASASASASEPIAAPAPSTVPTQVASGVAFSSSAAPAGAVPSSFGLTADEIAEESRLLRSGPLSTADHARLVLLTEKRRSSLPSHTSSVLQRWQPLNEPSVFECMRHLLQLPGVAKEFDAILPNLIVKHKEHEAKRMALEKEESEKAAAAAATLAASDKKHKKRALDPSRIDSPAPKKSKPAPIVPAVIPTIPTPTPVQHLPANSLAALPPPRQTIPTSETYAQAQIQQTEVQAQPAIQPQISVPLPITQPHPGLPFSHPRSQASPYRFGPAVSSPSVSTFVDLHHDHAYQLSLQTMMANAWQKQLQNERDTHRHAIVQAEKNAEERVRAQAQAELDEFARQANERINTMNAALLAMAVPTPLPTPVDDNKMSMPVVADVVVAPPAAAAAAVPVEESTPMVVDPPPPPATVMHDPTPTPAPAPTPPTDSTAPSAPSLPVDPLFDPSSTDPDVLRFQVLVQYLSDPERRFSKDEKQEFFRLRRKAVKKVFW